MKLSIIIPCKNKEGNISKLHKKIQDILNKIKYETIYVDDYSSDNTLHELHELYESDIQHVKVLSFSRNFNKEATILAGLEHASGEYTCILDINNDEEIKYISDMYDILENNDDCDIVAMKIKSDNDQTKRKKSKKEKIYSMMNKYSNLKLNANETNYRMFRKNVKNAIISFSEKNRFTEGIFSWIGFNTEYIEYDCDSEENENKLNTKALFGYTDKPLTLAIRLGIISLIVSFIYLIFVLIKIFGFQCEWTPIYALIILVLILFGIQFLLIGIVGKYLSLINDDIKNRPSYIVREKLGFNDETIL